MIQARSQKDTAQPQGFGFFEREAIIKQTIRLAPNVFHDQYDSNTKTNAKSSRQLTNRPN